VKELPSNHPCPGCGATIAGKARTCTPCRKHVCKLCRGFHPGCEGGRCPDCHLALDAATLLHLYYDRHRQAPPPGRVEALAERARRGEPLFG